MLPLLATLLSPAHAQDPELGDLLIEELVRVPDPNAPGALSRSATHALLAAPPESGAWLPEPVGVIELGQWSASEGIDAIGLQPWHDAGYQGQGVKVAVLDLQWYGTELETDELGDFESWDCWAQEGCTPPIDSLAPRFAYEVGAHGLACAEVVRDLAPQVELHLVRVNGLTTFENAAAWAIRNEIDVLTLSMSFFNSSFYDGTGPAGDVVESLSEGGVLLVTSAGNYARGHYQAQFNDPDGDGVHDFAEGGDLLPIFLTAGKRRGLSVHWDDYGKCGDTNVDLFLYAEDGTLLDRATRDLAGKGGCEPVERIGAWLEEDQWTYLKLVRTAGDDDFRWNLISTSGRVEGSMAQGSVTDPGTHPLAFTVGAAPSTNYLGNLEAFSSQGPNQAGHLKPDIVAPDGLSSSVYGPTGFYGTSAASPAAAATIAVVMSAHPTWTARDAADWLQSQAHRPLEPTWADPDNRVGAGHMVLPAPDATGPGCRGSWAFVFVLLPGLLRRRVAKARQAV
ncbi:MAG: S8 family serine peptidase [Myxococcota bacterium]|nr:S8 family serine peptidase [Myxococcota bacterium]